MMANRSYLFSTNANVFERAPVETDNILGIAEWKYEIPIVHKILASGNARKCDSIIFDCERPTAIAAEFRLGKNRLFKFLDLLESENIFPADKLRESTATAKRFINAVRQPFVLLEGAEIFDMRDGDWEEQNAKLFAEVTEIERTIAEFIDHVKNSNARLKTLESKRKIVADSSFIAKIFGGKQKLDKLQNELQAIEHDWWNKLGLGGWSQSLYFDFAD